MVHVGFNSPCKAECIIVTFVRLQHHQCDFFPKLSGQYVLCNKMQNEKVKKTKNK